MYNPVPDATTALAVPPDFAIVIPELTIDAVGPHPWSKTSKERPRNIFFMCHRLHK